MTCAACGRANPAGTEGCVACGAPLAARCASCGSVLPPAAKFCPECGTRTAPPGGEAGARKVVTVIFADLVGSTALHERLDAESARRLMERYYAALRGAVDAHGGTVVKLLGDGVMAAFGVRQVAEDDALRAVRAGVAMQEAFRALVRDQAALLGAVGLRVAVNTGEVVVSGAHDDLIGDPVNVAARLQEKGRDGDVVVGEETERLVATRVTLEPLGVLPLKGRSESVPTYRVVSLEPPAVATALPFVGRAEELARLDAVYAAAVAAPAARLAVLLGSPGLGKSRLIEEFAHRHGAGATVLIAHCDAAGAATFAPLVAALRAHLRIEDGAGAAGVRAAVDAVLGSEVSDRVRIATGVAALLAGSPPAPEETFFVVRRFLAALAATKPVVLVIDDMHWAEPLLLDLVEHLAQWGSRVPLLILVGGRPELRDLRPAFATPGGVVADVVTLAGLDAGAAMRLAANVIGAADLPAAAAAKVLGTSEGNPLYVGELMRMLVQEGALTRDGDRWIVGAGLAELEMPPTIHALLAARIERLRQEDRQVLERAAIVGRHFTRGAVAALLQDDADLDGRLEALRRSELIERDASWLLGEPALRFHHVLIRDAAYRRLLKGTRAELHGRLAEWFEGQVGEGAEQDETIGWHLEQAHHFLAELGPLDAAAVALGGRAAARLAGAGRRALTGDDVGRAAGLLGRAVACLGGDDVSRAELLLDWCEALLSAGDVTAAAAAIGELRRFAERAGEPALAAGLPAPEAGDAHAADARLAAWHTCFSGQLTVLTAPQELEEAAAAVAGAADALARLDDAAGEAKAHSVHAQALARLGRVGASEAALDRALAAARRAGDRRRANAVLAGAPIAALWGPSPITRASGRCLDVVRVLRITQGAPAVEAVALSCQGVLEALRGRTEAARRMLATSRQMVEDLGIAHRLHETDVFSGRIDLLEGDATGAARALHRAYDGLRQLGLGIDAARAGALLGRTLLAGARLAEAEALSHESEALAGDDLQAAIAWRGVRAEALARRGEHAAAIELAQAAVAIAAATDALLDHADARLALAAVLRAAGRDGDAEGEERRAIELWEAKGATLLAERTRVRTTARDSATGDVASAPAVSRRVRPNLASERSSRLLAALGAGDLHAIEALIAGDVRIHHHPTGIEYGRDGILEALRNIAESNVSVIQRDPLATLGESLTVLRQLISLQSFDDDLWSVGAIEAEAIMVEDVDAEGRLRQLEIFAANHLGDAVVRFCARYAELLPDGPARRRAETMACALSALVGQIDRDRIAAILAPTFTYLDHGAPTAAATGGATELDARLRRASGLVGGVADVLALTPDIVVLRHVHAGTGGDGGGGEDAFLSLFAFGGDGLVTRVEMWGPEDAAEALARADELGVRERVAVRRRVDANAATRQAEREWTAVAARDEAALLAAYPSTMDVVHHPSGAIYGPAEIAVLFRALWRDRSARLTQEILATLGDALALVRRRYARDEHDGRFGSIGPIESDSVVVLEVDDGAQTERAEVFDAERFGDAIARLYARHAERLPVGAERETAAVTSLAVAHLLTTWVAPDLSAIYSPSYHDVDHRIVGHGLATAEEASRLVDSFRELTADLRFRVDDVLALTTRGLVRRTTGLGTWREGGGAFERAVCVLTIFGPDGRITRHETFDDDRGAEALARFEELTATEEWTLGPAPSSPGAVTAEPAAAAHGLDAVRSPLGSEFSNRVTGLNEQFMRAWTARSWEAIEPLFAPELEMHDRRRLLQMHGAAETNTAYLRVLFDVPGSEWVIAPIATRGERLALSHYLFRGQAAEGGGPLAIEYLTVDEIDDSDRFVAVVLFDPVDGDAAYAELERRYEAGEGVAYPAHNAIMHAFAAAVASGDWTPVIALCAPTFIEHDHRALAVLGTTRGAAAWAENFRALTVLAPDTVYRVEHFRSLPAGFCSAGTWDGTRDGGHYEIPLIAILEVDAQGRLARADIYDREQVAPALARFAELGPDPAMASDATAALPSNLATAALERIAAASAVRDWDAFRAVCAPDARFENRSRTARIAGDLDLWIDNQRSISAQVHGVRLEMTLLGTAGERVAIAHQLFTSGPADALTQTTSLLVCEVNAAGLVAAALVFGSDDARAAQREAWARWAAVDPAAAAVTAALDAVLDAANEHDLARYRLCFAADLVIEDHRPGGAGRIDGVDAYLEKVAALWQFAPDARVDAGWIWPACAPYGAVTVTRRTGAIADEFLWLYTVADDRITRIEVFARDEGAAAQTRLAQLGP